MPVRICSVDDLSRPSRGRLSAVKQLPEYVELRAKLADGLKPQEAAEVTLPISDARGMKSILQTFSRTIKADLKRLHVPYTVEAYKSNGKNIIAVSNQPPITSSTKTMRSRA